LAHHFHHHLVGGKRRSSVQGPEGAAAVGSPTWTTWLPFYLRLEFPTAEFRRCHQASGGGAMKDAGAMGGFDWGVYLV
jgi:hypothetical protein